MDAWTNLLAYLGKPDMLFCWTVVARTPNMFLLQVTKSNDIKVASTYLIFIDESIVLLVTNSNVKHELTGGEYAQRRAQCYEGVANLQV